MDKKEFPLIISPNLGCPKLISIKEVFTWDENPENESRLKEFLVKKFSVEWVRNAKTGKIDNGKTLGIYSGKNSISLVLNAEKKIVNLKIDDGRTYELKAEMKNGKLNIYDISINIILAGQYGEFTHPTKEMFNNAFKLVPSFPEDFPDKKGNIILEIEGDITEITSWSQLFDFTDPEETQQLINSEIHYKILGEGTKYWNIKVVPKIEENEKSPGSFMKTLGNNDLIPTLYDIVFIDDKSNTKIEKINYHAVQFVESFDKCLNFIHLTDLHVAQRNDDILGEVLKKSETGIRKREEITKNFINFNDNLRKFIFAANKMRDEGKLDFIIITGDIVDFSGFGWDERIIPDENNWKVFIDIITGQGKENKRLFKLQTENTTENPNPGLKVAIFTTTGNHDWRLHPYNLLPLRFFSKEVQPGKNGEYGLNEDEAKNYNYKSFDSIEYPGDKRKELSDALVKESLNKLNLDARSDKWIMQATKITGWLSVQLGGGAILTALAGLIGAGGPLYFIYQKWDSIVNFAGSIPILVAIISIFAVIVGAIFFVVRNLIEWIINSTVETKLRQFFDLLVDNPIHAEARSLHYYFTHINPYFDYAFSFGNNHFIMMDTGADVAAIKADNLKDKVETKYLKKLSIQDNLGSSPDSMAFDDRQSFYNWEQIVWLDKVLAAISKKKKNAGKGRIFIGLHAPPVNYDTKEKKKLFDLRESETRTYIKAKKEESVWDKLNVFKKSEPKEDNEKSINLTYGTVNHYLSQFFFMCNGYRENPDRDKKSRPLNKKVDKVDLVLSGHAHIDIEFRLEIDENTDDENKIRIYYDTYSKTKNYPDFDNIKPVIVQTASCGPPSADDRKPTSEAQIDKNKEPFVEFDNNRLPHWRMVMVDKNNSIKCFKHENMDKWIKDQIP